MRPRSVTTPETPCRRRLNAAHRAFRQYCRAFVARSFGDCGRGLLRLGAAIGGRVERSFEFMLSRAGGPQAPAAHHAALELIAFEIATPAFMLVVFLVVRAGENNAGAFVAGVAAHPSGRALPISAGPPPSAELRVDPGGKYEPSPSCGWTVPVRCRPFRTGPPADRSRPVPAPWRCR